MSRFIFYLSAFLFTSTLHAQTTPSITDTLELEDVVITASKIPQTQRGTTKPVIIIDRKQIEQSGMDLPQILNSRSGIRINQAYGAPAENKSVYLQGGAGEQALILVDGLAIADPSGTGGAFDIRQFPVENIERIEVLKGSQSTLYGTDAISGVVNIITRSGTGKPLQAGGQLSYGAYNTFNGNLGIHGDFDRTVNYSVNYSRETSDGFSAAAEPEGEGSFENDGLNRNSFSAKVSVSPTDVFTLTPSVNYTSYEGDYDEAAFTDAGNRFTMDMLHAGLNMEYGGEFLSLYGGYNYTHTDRLFSSENWGDSEFEGQFHNADLYGVRELTEGVQLLAGLNYQHSKLPGDENISAETVSPYATLLLKNLYGFSAEVGYRLNNHSVYGTNSTLSFAPSFRFSEQAKLYAGVGTGFKAPTLDELFGPFGANEELDPQRSTYYNAGLEVYLLDNALKADLQYFNREVEDVIVYLAASGYQNRGQQQTSGVEVSVNWLASSLLTAGLNYNYLTGEMITEENGDQNRENNLIRRPSHSFGGNLNLRLTEEWLLNLNGSFVGERQDLYYNPETFTQEEVTLDPYTLLNLHTEYTVRTGITVFGNIRNLLNAEFTEVYGFNTTGFAATGGIRFSL